MTLPEYTAVSIWFWVGFLSLIGLLLAIDLGLAGRRHKELSLFAASVWTGVWISCALAFNVWVYFEFGSERALEFLAGYVIEQALSIDNIFVFIVVFSYFGVPAAARHRVLFLGILGAIIMRGAFIFLGSLLIARFHWILYVFGVLLIYTAFRMLREQDHEPDIAQNPAVRFCKRWLPCSTRYYGNRFIAEEAGKIVATPLVIVLVVIETTDLVFAIDSIPAIFAITKDPFIIFTSNIFAILGLRSLYFVLSSALVKLRYLKTGLAIVLGFIGTKMLLEEVFKVPVLASLAIIASILTITVVASLRNPYTEAEKAAQNHGS
jgi:tellurite resistance protein TerC